MYAGPTTKVSIAMVIQDVALVLKKTMAGKFAKARVRQAKASRQCLFKPDQC